MEQVGTIYVDAGIVMVGDPCYTLPDTGSSRNSVARNWSEFCDATFENEGPEGVYKPLDDGTAIVVSSGWGDGVYPVYIKRNHEGRIAELIVKFIP